MSKNLFALYTIKFAKWFMIIMPIIALFYKENGLEASDLFILKAIYSLATGAMEIPSGYLADILGRRKTLIAGSILGTLGFALYSTTGSFEWFIIAEITLGIGQSFISGADSALLYDSLKSEGRTKDFLKHEGRITAIGNYAETFAIVAGGSLASFLAFKDIYVLQTLIMGLGIPASILLTEPERDKPQQHPSLKSIFGVIHSSIISNPILGSSVLLSSVIGLATLAMAWGTQAYLAEMGFGEVTISSVLIGLNLTVSIVAMFPHIIIEKLTPKYSLLLIIATIPTIYLIVGTAPVYIAISCLILFYAIRGIATPMLKDYINKNCDSDYRATVLSIRSLIIRISFAFLGTSMGTISDKFGIQNAFLAGFAFTASFTFIIALWFYRSRMPKQSLIPYLLRKN